MNRDPLVFILILNYDGGKPLSLCLQSLLRLDYTNTRIVVIDNASTDGSFEEAKRISSRASFIRNSENVGFAKGINVGLRFAINQGADFVWLLNPDATASTNSLRKLIDLMRRNPQIGIASPIILSPNRKVWFGGGIIRWMRFRATHEKPLSLTSPFETEFVSGCALLIRRAVLESIGLLDEHFFLYYEDVDFSLRARKAGFQAVIHPKSTVIHSEESQKNPRKTYWLIRSGLFFFRKHFYWPFMPYFWLAFWTRRGRFALKNRGSQIKSKSLIEKAFRDFLSYGY